METGEEQGACDSSPTSIQRYWNSVFTLLNTLERNVVSLYECHEGEEVGTHCCLVLRQTIKDLCGLLLEGHGIGYKERRRQKGSNRQQPKRVAD